MGKVLFLPTLVRKDINRLAKKPTVTTLPNVPTSSVNSMVVNPVSSGVEEHNVDPTAHDFFLEKFLGFPEDDDYILRSKKDGTRYWVQMISGGLVEWFLAGVSKATRNKFNLTTSGPISATMADDTENSRVNVGLTVDAYSKNEMDTALSGKAASNHNHDSSYAALSHNHDDRYYTETEVDDKLDLVSSNQIFDYDPGFNLHMVQGSSTIYSPTYGFFSSGVGIDTVYKSNGQNMYSKLLPAGGATTMRFKIFYSAVQITTGHNTSNWSLNFTFSDPTTVLTTNTFPPGDYESGVDSLTSTLANNATYDDKMKIITLDFDISDYTDNELLIYSWELNKLGTVDTLLNPLFVYKIQVLFI